MTEPTSVLTFVTVCPFCGGETFSPLGERSDGVPVLQCERCRMGFVARRSADTSAFYSDAYYADAPSAAIGYSDYELVAEHSLAWAAELVRLLRPEGRVLDVGCATGHLLRSLGPAYETYGIEVNESLSRACAAAGIRMLGRDICDPGLRRRYSGFFDVITAIATLEHVADMRGAVEQIRDLLAPGGVLLFEVPLLSATEDNSVWFRSSLEHITYPTLEGLDHLFRDVFAAPLLGREVVIKDYASTFVGLAVRGDAEHRKLAAWLQHLLDTPVPELASPAERAFRLSFDLVHAASPAPDTVDLITDLPAARLTRPLLHRLAALWKTDLARVEALRQALEQFGDPALTALHGRLETVQAMLDRERALSARLEAGKARLEQELAARGRELAVRDSRMADLRDRLAARDSRIAGLQAELAASAARADALQAQLTRQEQTNRTLLASTSWRLAAPLRLLGRRLQRLPLSPGTGLWTSLRSAYRLLPLPRWTKERLVHAALRKGYLRPLPAPPGTAPGNGEDKDEPATVLLQEPWPATRPLVSVVIPCYNYGHWAGEAIDSLLAQTFQDFEILVVDGGSGAESLQALRALERPKTRIYYRTGRHFVGDNRNFGIARARGKYICCLDADDMLRPTYLEKALFLLETRAYDVVSTSIQTFGEETGVYGVKRFPVLADMVQGNHVPTCAVFRRDLWERAGGYQDNGIGRDYFYEDWRLWVRFAALGARIANIVDEPLFRYRVHSQGSLSKQNEAVPAIDRQREAVSAFNRDVLTAEAYERSEQRARQQIEVLDGLVNVQRMPAASAGSPTVLIALPFLIIGGAERLISEVAFHLRSRGYRLAVVTTLPVDPKHGDATEWLEPATAEIYHLPRFLDAADWKAFLFHLIAAKNVSLLWLTGSAFVYGLLPEIKAEWPRLKVIDLLFNTVGHTASNRKYSALIDLTLVENAEVQDWLHAAGELPERIVQVPSGVDLERYRPAPRADGALAELGIDPSAFIVGFSGRLSEEKSPETFLEIAGRCRDDPRLVFLMTGAGPLAEAVRQHAESLGLGKNLQLLGLVPDVRKILALYDVLVLPSRLDGRPVVVLESLALGVPVVASGVGALPELIQEGETGFLCAPGDVAAFADRIRWLAGHPGEHRRMSAAARAFAEAELDARRMFQRYEEALRTVLLGSGQEMAAVPRSFPPGKGRPVVLLLPFFTVGGAERVIETLLADWRAEDRTVAVFTTQPLDSGMADRSADLRALTPFCYSLRDLLPRERWLDTVAEALLALPRPVLFSVGCAWFYEAVEELKLRVPGLRTVDQLFNAVCHLDLNRAAAGSLDLTVTAYAGLAAMVLADGRPAARVETVYVGIEPPRAPAATEVAALRESLGVPPHGKLVAFVGRLAEEKRPDWVVRLGRELGQPDVTVLIVGDGPLSAVVDAGIRNEESLRWLRRVDAIEPVFAAADVVVLPSRFEGIPLTVMEALALGRPVVATNAGGLPELAGAPGLAIVDRDDFAAFVEAVRRFLHEAPQGISLPAGFSAAEMVRRYAEILD